MATALIAKIENPSPASLFSCAFAIISLAKIEKRQSLAALLN
jgi:hypothetical protein